MNGLQCCIICTPSCDDLHRSHTSIGKNIVANFFMHLQSKLNPFIFIVLKCSHTCTSHKYKWNVMNYMILRTFLSEITILIEIKVVAWFNFAYETNQLWWISHTETFWNVSTTGGLKSLKLFVIVNTHSVSVFLVY